MGWEEEFLDMTNDKQGMMASSPQKIESWQQELLDITAGKSTVRFFAHKIIMFITSKLYAL